MTDSANYGDDIRPTASSLRAMQSMAWLQDVCISRHSRPNQCQPRDEKHTEVIRKGKASKPTEFGKMVKIQEAEARIVTHYEVYNERPSDRDLLIPANAMHNKLLHRSPYLVTADAAFFSQRNETAASNSRHPQSIHQQRAA
jgi:hypothetical protein